MNEGRVFNFEEPAATNTDWLSVSRRAIARIGGSVGRQLSQQQGVDVVNNMSVSEKLAAVSDDDSYIAYRTIDASIGPSIRITHTEGVHFHHTWLMAALDNFK